MTKTLQEKIKKIFATSGQGCGDSYSNEELVNKAIQELRKEIEKLKINWNMYPIEALHRNRVLNEVLALIGEKK